MNMIQDVLKEKYEDCLDGLDIYENTNSLILSRIIVNKKCRDEGKRIGTKVMNDLIDYADTNGQIIALTPSSDFGGDVNRLIQFYKRFGFKMNNGTNKYFSLYTMLRYPIQKGQKRINEGNGVMIKMVKNLIENSRQTLEEIKKESYETYLLIQKHISGKTLTKEEKRRLLSNLKDILTKLGYGAIFMLPGGTVLLLILNIFNNKIKKKKTDMVNEIRVINPDTKLISTEEPLKDSDTIRVYHGFNNYEDAIMAIKFGFSGKEKAKRIYSYEANNNPNGLFVTLDFETAKKFTHPRGKKGISVILELSVKVSDLEAPVWPGGSYTVQGQLAQFWKDSKDRYEQGTLKAREKAKTSDIDFISNSDRPEVAATLMGSERQALFTGDINPNMVKNIFYGESGKHGISPSRFERISPKEFLNKFETHEPERDAFGNISNKGYEYGKKKNKLFKPNDDFSIDKLKGVYGYDSGEELLKDLIKHDELETYLYPKQINQLKDRNMINEDKLKGGKADKLTKKDIANKFGVTVAKINKELDMGIEIELEHTKSRRLAKEIAMDHLTEIPDYYTRLKKMEKEGKSKWKKREKKLDETTKEFIRGLVRLNLND